LRGKKKEAWSGQNAANLRSGCAEGAAGGKKEKKAFYKSKPRPFTRRRWKGEKEKEKEKKRGLNCPIREFFSSGSTKLCSWAIRRGGKKNLAMKGNDQFVGEGGKGEEGGKVRFSLAFVQRM